MKSQYLLFYAFIVLILSCSKQDDTSLTTDDNKVLNSFVVSIESVRTKTSLVSGDNSFSLVWDANDKISVSDGKVVSEFVKDNSNTQGNVFKQSGNEKFNFYASRFVAFYPSSLSVNNMVLPSEQHYREDNVENYPMYAESLNNKLEFHNLCGILSISVSTNSVEPVKISQINVSSESPLSGEFKIEENSAIMTEKENKGIILMCSETIVVSNSNACVFNIVLPVGEYNPLYLKFISPNGTVKSLKSSNAVDIFRSKVTRVNLQLTSDSFYPELEGLDIIDDEEVNFTDR